jgi:arylsulfatase A-like enzyme
LKITSARSLSVPGPELNAVRRRSTVRGLLICGLTVLACLFAIGCGSGGPGPTRGYILISLDTLSAEHMSLYGYHRPTTPFLDRLAQRAIVFDNAFVQLPGTLPSHMSIMTALYPDQHGVMPPDGVLSEKITTLPEVFQSRGYRTAGFSEGGYVSGRFGFSRGFEVYDDSFKDLWRNSPNVLDSGLAFIDSLPDEESFFLFIHTYAVHAPYLPPEQCRDLFWPADPPDVDPPLGPNLRDHNDGIALIDRETADYYAALYDAEVRCLDMRLEKFFSELDGLGVAQDVTVVVTSDHGEEFLDHGMLVHRQIYVENTHVPLILIHPEITAGRRIGGLAESIDIAPTLYDIAAINGPPAISGRSHLPAIGGGIEQVRDHAVSQSATGDRGLFATANGRLMHLLSIRPQTKAGAQTGAASFLRLRVPRGRLSFKATAFLEPVNLSFVVDGVLLSELGLEAGHWQQIDESLPDGAGTALVELTADSCHPIPQSIERGGRRCRSFSVRGLPVKRFELYDLASDPREKTDLSADEPALIANLGERLSTLMWQPVASTHNEPIDEELKEQLKMLGYLDEPRAGCLEGDRHDD